MAMSVKQTAASLPQPQPASNDLPFIHELVMQDIQERAKVGKAEYGTYLQPHNGRSAKWDKYQELLDAAQYARQEIYEDEHPQTDRTSM